MLSILSLGSGSSGNSAVVYSDKTTILVDAGLSAMQLKKRIIEGGLDPQNLDAILITHEHSDHTKGLEVLSKSIFMQNDSIKPATFFKICIRIQDLRILMTTTCLTQASTVSASAG